MERGVALSLTLLADGGGSAGTGPNTTVVPPVLPEPAKPKEEGAQTQSAPQTAGAAADPAALPTGPTPPPIPTTGIRRVDSEERSIAAFMAHTSPLMVSSGSLCACVHVCMCAWVYVSMGVCVRVLLVGLLLAVASRASTNEDGLVCEGEGWEEFFPP